MKIVEQHFLRGPNLYARRPCFLAVLDLEELDGVSSADIPGFSDRLCALLPSLQEHRCSLGHVGGFIERLREGTYMAHIVEHVAIELQCLAGTPVGFGKARMVDGMPRHYRVVFAYRLERVAEHAFGLAIEFVTAIARGETPQLRQRLDILREVAAKRSLGPSTRAVIEAARRRGIPSLRMTEEANLFQLGWGCRQQRLQATISGATGYLAVNIASDKQLTKALLEEAGLPVPQGGSVSSAEQALLLAHALGAPVTIKPLDANQGKGVTTEASNDDEVVQAFEQAQRYSSEVIVENFIRGNDYRVLVTGGKIAAASLRRPPSVTGDGSKTIRELVEAENCDPARGEGHDTTLTKIMLDEHAHALLQKQGLDFDAVPAAGRNVVLRGNANLSTGGTAEDVTDLVHPDTRVSCIRAAQKIGLDIAGIDLICGDIGLPLDRQGGAIIEINAAPGIRMHQFPRRGRPRDAGAAIVDAMFAPHDNGRIPLIAVTGTNGKTTTVLLIAHALQMAGLTTGATTTEGVFINGRCITKGDCTGYWSARTLLTAPEVETAVLETARGGILRRGLAFDRCDIGVVLNVSADHLGLDGVNTVEDLARVKAVVAEAAGSTAVLNAEDPHCVAMAETVNTGAEVMYFSMDADNGVLLRHLASGGRAVYLHDATLVVADGKRQYALLEAARMPVSLHGHARYNIANALAAAAALIAAGYGAPLIAAALGSFVSDARHNPLRMNVFDIRGITVIVDYAHNVAACHALSQTARSLSQGRLVAVATVPGDRRDQDLRQIGRTCAAGFDELVVYESELRGRAPGAIARLLEEGARSIVAPEYRLHRELDARDAIGFGLRRCEAGDLLVIVCANSLQDLIEAVRRIDPMSAAIIAEAVT